MTSTNSNSKSGQKRVVVIGSGFAGINFVRDLAHDSSFSITLIDKKNHHLFQPLLYQVATAGLSPADIAVPIRSVFSKFENVEVILDEITSVDRSQKTITGAAVSYNYDFLVVACGAVDSYFGHEDWVPHAPGLKSVEQATEIRRRILIAFEEAEKERDPDKMRAWLTFVVVGGGPTGVELAGSIAELSRVTLSRDFRHINPQLARVILMEAGPRVLASFHPSLSESARIDLEDMGVQVWCGSRVSSIAADGVRYGQDWISTRTAFWAAGVQASPIGRSLGESGDRQGRVAIDEFLNLKNDPAVFVLGDMALFLQDGRPLPGVASVAIQQGRFLAKHLRSRVKAKKPKPFVFFDKGSMATIGRNRAVLQLKNFRMSGRLAWFAWLFIHIYYLIGFQNRIAVFLQWAWAYLTYKRGARLITSSNWKKADEGLT